MEHLCPEVQLGCQSHSQGDDNNVVLRALRAGGVGGRQRRARAAGGSGLRWGALPRGAGCWAAVPGSPRASLVAPRPRPRAGGCPGNGRAQLASAAAPVYYCDSSYFLFGGLREIKIYIPSLGGRGSW